MRYTLTIIVLFLLINSSAISQTNTFTKYNDPRINIIGRVADKDSLLEMYWSGTSIKINFSGSSISATFKDEKGYNYYNIIVDGKLSKILKLDTLKKTYLLIQNLKKGDHTLEIFKRTEWDQGITSFYGFETDDLSKILPKKSDSPLKIEYFGNSITAGYAIEDNERKDRHEGLYTNHFETYAALTARHFNAEHHCTCKSGIGIMISWFPLTMPQMYDRLNPEDSSSKWDFNKFVPDIVVINLLQNDSWLIHNTNYPTFKTTFGNTPPTEDFIIKSYKNFVLDIRNKYPNSSIICMLGNMDITKPGSKWPNYVKTAVSQINDKKIHTLFIPFKGTKAHPLKKDNKKMANILIKYINDHILK